MENLFIRTEKPRDYLAILEVIKRAFGRDNEARLVDALRAAPEFIPDLSMIAEVEGRLVGHILFSQVLLETSDDQIRLLALAPLAVQPELQNRGIGSMLVMSGLEKSRQLGHKAVVVLGHPSYYPRFGFQSSRIFGVISPFPVPDEVFMLLELYPGAIGKNVGTIRYPVAFDAV